VLVGAARLNLKRHTLAQVVAGSALGVLIPLLVFATM
jgi:membrane-associated phospholipid phosphatase